MTKEICNHCWHDMGYILTSYPPQQPEVCCYCGEQRIKPQPKFEPESGHGKFAPYKTYTSTSTKLNDY